MADSDAKRFKLHVIHEETGDESHNYVVNAASEDEARFYAYSRGFAVGNIECLTEQRPSADHSSAPIQYRFILLFLRIAIFSLLCIMTTRLFFVSRQLRDAKTRIEYLSAHHQKLQDTIDHQNADLNTSQRELRSLSDRIEDEQLARSAAENQLRARSQQLSSITREYDKAAVGKESLQDEVLRLRERTIQLANYINNELPEKVEGLLREQSQALSDQYKRSLDREIGRHTRTISLLEQENARLAALLRKTEGESSTALPLTTKLVDTRIVSSFDGFEYGKVFELENGQIWKQTDMHLSIHITIRPRCIIYRDGGNYKLAIEKYGEFTKGVRVEQLK